MARFIFELEAVLELRRREEDAARLAVAEVERERVELESRLRRCREAIDQEREESRRALGVGGIALGDVRRQTTATVALDARARELVVQLAGVHVRLERRRVSLRAATSKRKGVELLRERRHEAWRLEQSRAEAGLLDELAVMRPRHAEIDP